MDQRRLEVLIEQLMARGWARGTVITLMVLCALWLLAMVALPLVVIALSLKDLVPTAFRMLVWLTLFLWVGGVTILMGIRRHFLDTNRFRRGTRSLMEAAQGGDTAAMRTLAQAYEAGHHGLPKDLAQRAWWLSRLAETGDRPAMLELARMLEVGEGILRDRLQAQAWRDRAGTPPVLQAVAPAKVEPPAPPA